VTEGEMDSQKEAPVMLPFVDKEGAGWHVIVRYHEGHERRIDGFASEKKGLGLDSGQYQSGR
jgi:hypothetical protein